MCDEAAGTPPSPLTGQEDFALSESPLVAGLDGDQRTDKGLWESDHSPGAQEGSVTPVKLAGECRPRLSRLDSARVHHTVSQG